MIFLVERVPLNISPEDSLQTCYMRNKTTVQDSLQIAEIERQKVQFYAFFSRIFTDKNFMANVSVIAPQKAYLLSTVDLLEIGERANLSFVQNYTPFLNIYHNLDLQKDNRSVLLGEYILARYTYGLATIKSLKKPIQLQMNNLTKTDTFRPEELKEIIETFKEGFLRIAKLYKHRATIWVV